MLISVNFCCNEPNNICVRKRNCSSTMNQFQQIHTKLKRLSSSTSDICSVLLFSFGNNDGFLLSHFMLPLLLLLAKCIKITAAASSPAHETTAPLLLFFFFGSRRYQSEWCLSNLATRTIVFAAQTLMHLCKRQITDKETRTHAIMKSDRENK